MSKYLLRLNLQLFADDLGVEGGEGANPAEPPIEPTEIIEPPIDPQPPAEPPTPPVDDLDQSKAFSKRLEERLQKERQKWEEETSQKYGNYDQYQQTLDYVMKTSGFNTFEEFQAALQDAQLQERAQQNQVPTEFQQRVEQLEERAKRADELEQERESQQVMEQFRSHLTEFSKEKGIEADQLEQFMMENQIPSFDMAYRAMRYEQMETDLKNAKDVAIKEYLESKKAPKVEGGGNPGIIKDAPPKNFAEARQRALERLKSADIQE